jgi:hypothetical protein
MGDEDAIVARLYDKQAILAFFHMSQPEVGTGSAGADGPRFGCHSRFDAPHQFMYNPLFPEVRACSKPTAREFS